MPTTDERRQVAARLRKAEIDNLGLTYSVHLGEAIGECVRLVSGHECLVESGLNRLADLIEPLPERTCKPIDPFDKETKHIVERGLSHYYWPYKGCPECQRDFPQGSNFCPNCGSKVVE